MATPQAAPHSAAAGDGMLRNILTIIFSILAGIVLCACIAGILYGAGVFVMHLGDGSSHKADAGTKATDTDTSGGGSTDNQVTIVHPPPATVYRHEGVDPPEIIVMFAKVKKDAGGVYDVYQIKMFTNSGTGADMATTILTTALDEDQPPEEAFQTCPNDDGNHADMYVCFDVLFTYPSKTYKFTYQPYENDSPIGGLLSEKSGEVNGALGAAAEASPFKQDISGGNSGFITNVVAAAASGFITAIILVAAINCFKKKDPAKERLLASGPGTIV
eukprot:157903_1